jgi:hypothetical protein
MMPAERIIFSDTDIDKVGHTLLTKRIQGVENRQRAARPFGDGENGGISSSIEEKPSSCLMLRRM